MNWIKLMFNKKMELLSSLRFWMIFIGYVLEYLSEVQLTGFQPDVLYQRIGMFVWTVAFVGTVDKWPKSLKK